MEDGNAITEAGSAADLVEARRLFIAYLAELGLDLSFQNVDEEIESLPHPYALPEGAILLARDGAGRPVGVVALKPLPALGPGTAEMKRLWVAPEMRGTGLAARLVTAIEDAARARGYRLLKLDTLARLKAANKLYDRLGYRACAAYNHNPYPDIRYFEKAL